MQKNYIALALAAALTAGSLGGCATDPSTGLPTISPTVLSNIETDVQQGTAAICSFIPTLNTIAGVVASFISGGTAVVNVAAATESAICSAVAAAPKSAPTATVVRGQHRMVQRLLTTPVVNGVPIDGYFLK